MTDGEFRERLDRSPFGRWEFARLVGVTKRSVDRWIAGDVPVPEPVARLLVLLGTHPELAGVLRSQPPSGPVSDDAVVPPEPERSGRVLLRRVSDGAVTEGDWDAETRTWHWYGFGGPEVMQRLGLVVVQRLDDEDTGRPPAELPEKP